ncbi:hypothetical protein [Undibacterium terreum]|uniref:Uncharacterized protein n=1 Tax=Undibacterium terreum TaxID=1224302 RepID=A0A916U7A4_9BURK|nr:hypothetical protein [Undibacterium terreum]GGC63286.1 hypothetical protein GCM10011396_07810 [Undibacterium terreum]
MAEVNTNAVLMQHLDQEKMTGYLPIHAAHAAHAAAPMAARNSRRIALPVIIALHMLFVYFWMSARHHLKAEGADAEPLIMRFFSPQPKADAEPETRPQPVPRIKPEFLPPPVFVQAPEKILAPKEAAETKAVPAAQTPSATAPAADFTSSAMRGIGKIDRDLRKEFPRFEERAPESKQSKLEKGIAAAGIPQTTTMQERALPDGSRITKVSGPAGSYCVMSGSVANNGGVDIMQRGVHNRTVNCAHYFD